MPLEVLRYATTADLANEVARRLLDLLARLQDDGSVPQIALTGGTFASTLFHEIRHQAPAFAIDWRKVEFWWGDDRFVSPDSPDRNAREARQAFLDALGVIRIHEMATPNSACSVDEGARAYEAQLRNDLVDGFDLVLLSLGPDGHVASLFPGSPQLNVVDRVAVGVTGSPKPPPQRITLTVEALNRTARMWLFAADSGAGGVKESAFRAVLADDPSMPATLVHGRDETIWFVS
jgi:6-phosphogluconolactonase